VILGASTPTLALPRKRERERAAVGASHQMASTLHGRKNITGIPSIWQSALPLPLAGEGWGGGIHVSEVEMDHPKRPTWKVSSRLRSNVRALRKSSTDAERILWSELRDHRLIGASFRRQVPIENYIADVLRFSNHDVMTNRAGVLETIVAAIEASTPTLALPRKRERERYVPAGKRSS